MFHFETYMPLKCRHQSGDVVVVENSYLEYCGVDAQAQEEGSDKAHHLVKRKKIEKKITITLWIFDHANLPNTFTSMQM